MTCVSIQYFYFYADKQFIVRAHRALRTRFEKNYLIREGSSFFMAGVIVPARDRGGTSRWNFEARDLEVELVSEALEAGIQINILLSNILRNNYC